MSDRQSFIDSLRRLANFLEDHPAVTTPRFVNINAFVKSKEELLKTARAATWTKNYVQNWFSLKRQFGPHLSYEVNAGREEVCRKIVTGTRVVPARPAEPERTEEIYEWACDPLLGGEDGTSADIEVRARDEDPSADAGATRED